MKKMTSLEYIAEAHRLNSALTRAIEKKDVQDMKALMADMTALRARYVQVQGPAVPPPPDSIFWVMKMATLVKVPDKGPRRIEALRKLRDATDMTLGELNRRMELVLTGERVKLCTMTPERAQYLEQFGIGIELTDLDE